jgi:hypothetical protein
MQRANPFDGERGVSIALLDAVYERSGTTVKSGTSSSGFVTGAR